MSIGNVLKKGDYLFKELDKIPSIFIVQSGQLSLVNIKNKKNVEICTVGAGFVFAENIVLGVPHYSYSALALQECKVIEIPIDIFKEQYESFHPIFKSLIKNQSDKIRWSFSELRNKKSEREGLACGYDDILKVFQSIVLVTKTRGTLEGQNYALDWEILKNLNQRFFHESNRRTEQALLILSKLGFIELIRGDVDLSASVLHRTEIETVKLKNVQILESALDFFQYAFYKSGASELLKIEDSNYLVLLTLMICFENEKPDSYGMVSMSYETLSEKFSDYGHKLQPVTFSGLESRGLICKIKSIDNEKSIVQFEKNEFEIALYCWKLLKEIDKWNEKGLVDDEQVLTPQKKLIASDKVKCSSCRCELSVQAKFCSECGNKLDVIKQAA